MSDKVMKAIKSHLNLGSVSHEQLFIYKEWNIGGGTRGRYQYRSDDKIISYFLHIYKDMVKVWLPKNGTGAHDLLLELK